MSFKPNIYHVAAIAIMCHQINRAYCAALGDMSQKPWPEAPQWQRDSAVKGVLFHLENPQAGPEASHESWLKEKLDTGWVYGQVKNEYLKEHPCCVPFAQLPVAQKAKDHLFKAIVHEARHMLESALYPGLQPAPEPMCEANAMEWVMPSTTLIPNGAMHSSMMGRGFDREGERAKNIAMRGLLDQAGMPRPAITPLPTLADLEKSKNPISDAKSLNPPVGLHVGVTGTTGKIQDFPHFQGPADFGSGGEHF